MAKLRVLALAAARRRVGSVVLDGTMLLDWRISDKAAENTNSARSHIRSLLADFSPDVVVTEEMATARHKGKRTHDITESMFAEAEEAGLLAVSLPRTQRFKNKYDEAEALVAEFPELAPWLPVRRRFYDNEPRNTVLFEALSLGCQLTEGRQVTPEKGAERQDHPQDQD
jgi:ribosomal protein L17